MFRYKYADLDCDYCLYCKKCTNEICPYIMDCLEDLRHDKAFYEAIENADSCDKNHKQTRQVSSYGAINSAPRKSI